MNHTKHSRETDTANKKQAFKEGTMDNSEKMNAESVPQPRADKKVPEKAPKEKARPSKH